MQVFFNFFRGGEKMRFEICYNTPHIVRFITEQEGKRKMRKSAKTARGGG